MDNFFTSTGFIATLSGVVTTFVAGFCGWFFTKKKYNSEVKSNDIENMQKTLDFYKKLSDDNTARLEEILEKNQGLTAQVSKLTEENIELKILVQKQTAQIENLQKEVAALTKSIAKIHKK